MTMSKDLSRLQRSKLPNTCLNVGVCSSALVRTSIWLALAVLTGCSSAPMPLVSDLGIPPIWLPHAVRMVDTVDRPANLIERSLSECDKRIAAGEAACIKRSLAEAKLSISDLIAMLPRCSAGQVCHYQYATDDRVGLIPALATHFQMRWQVDLDFTKPAGKSDDIPVSVKQI